jgi:hypothetical protein
MAYKLKPPFEIYHNGNEISDSDGHLCTAESPEVAEAIVAALNLAQRLAPSLVVPSQNHRSQL